MLANRLAKHLGLAVALLAFTAPTADAEFIYALTTNNSLIAFDSATPGSTTSPLAITGVGSETILDIDLRPANGLLYGFSSMGNLYSIDPTTGQATLSASLSGVALDPNATRVGIDFNPTVDRLRIVTNTGQDLRLTPGTGVTTIDSPLNGAAIGAVSVAYTNNFGTATSTTLFYIGPSTPTSLFNTSNPNGGVLSLVGSLGLTSSQNVGFDISGLSGIAYASFQSPTGGASSLYTINLTTGGATLIGTIGNGLTIRGLAAPIGVPEPSSFALCGISGMIGLAVARSRGKRAAFAWANHREDAHR